MTDEKKPGRHEKPDLETDTLRVWKGRRLLARKREAVEGRGLTIRPGERVHEALVLDLGRAGTLKVLAKERMEDGRISILLKHQEPCGKVRVARPRTWLSRAEYDRAFGPLKECLGTGSRSVIPGAEIEAGVERAAGVRGRKGRCGRRGDGGAPVRPRRARAGRGDRGGCSPSALLDFDAVNEGTAAFGTCTASPPLPRRASWRVLRRHHLMHGGVDSSRLAARRRRALWVSAVTEIEANPAAHRGAR